MRISYRQHLVLRRTGRRLRQSDPHLAAMLAIFARLAAGEAIISTEQMKPHGIRGWRLVALLAAAVAGLVTLAGLVFRRAASASAAVCSRFSRTASTALSTSPAARDPGDPI